MRGPPKCGQGLPWDSGHELGEGGPDGRAFEGGRGQGGAGADDPLSRLSAMKYATSSGGERRLVGYLSQASPRRRRTKI